jgi:hypothetical protein
MIKINDKFVIDQDLYSWTLTYNYAGKDKDGNNKQQSKQTYHANLKQVASCIINYSAKECESMNQLITMLNNAENIVGECLLKLKEKQEKVA